MSPATQLSALNVEQAVILAQRIRPK